MARIAGIDPRRIRAELGGGKVVIVAGFQGMSVTPLDGLDNTPTATQLSTEE